MSNTYAYEYRLMTTYKPSYSILSMHANLITTTDYNGLNCASTLMTDFTISDLGDCHNYALADHK